MATEQTVSKPAHIVAHANTKTTPAVPKRRTPAKLGTPKVARPAKRPDRKPVEIKPRASEPDLANREPLSASAEAPKAADTPHGAQVVANVDAGPVGVVASNELASLEQVIGRGLKTFFDVGHALARIRERELYRDTHASFEQYCLLRWHLRRAHAYRLINAAAVVENVSNWRHQKLSLPTVESQARELAKLPPKEQPKAWAHVVKTAPRGVITAQHVAKVVATRLSEPTPKTAKTQPKEPASIVSTAPAALAVTVARADVASALADLESDLLRHLRAWTWGTEGFAAKLEAFASKAREQFVQEAANG